MLSVVKGWEFVPECVRTLHNGQKAAPRRKPKSFYDFGYDPICKQYDQESNFNNDIVQKVCGYSADLFCKNYFRVNPARFLVEVHNFSLTGNEGTVKPAFDWHEDDQGGISFDVCTVIYYLRKDPTIEGGNLEFQDMPTVEIEAPMAVLFRGDMTHRAEAMYGYGERSSVVVQMERIE